MKLRHYFKIAALISSLSTFFNVFSLISKGGIYEKGTVYFKACLKKIKSSAVLATCSLIIEPFMLIQSYRVLPIPKNPPLFFVSYLPKLAITLKKLFIFYLLSDCFIKSMPSLFYITSIHSIRSPMLHCSELENIYIVNFPCVPIFHLHFVLLQIIVLLL